MGLRIGRKAFWHCVMLSCFLLVVQGEIKNEDVTVASSPLPGQATNSDVFFGGGGGGGGTDQTALAKHGRITTDSPCGTSYQAPRNSGTQSTDRKLQIS